jgi:hypothetical protein
MSSQTETTDNFPWEVTDVLVPTHSTDTSLPVLTLQSAPKRCVEWVDENGLFHSIITNDDIPFQPGWKEYRVIENRVVTFSHGPG